MDIGGNPADVPSVAGGEQRQQPDRRVLSRMCGTGQVDPQASQDGPLAVGDGPPDGAGAQGAWWQVERHLTEGPPGLEPAPHERGDLSCHLDVTEMHRGAAPRGPAQFGGDLDGGYLPGGRGVPGVGRLHQGHAVGQVQAGDQVHLALMRVARPGMHQHVGGRLVHRPDQPAGRRFDDLDGTAPGPAQAGARRAATTGPADDRPPAAQHPAPDEGLGDRDRLRPEQCQVSLSQRQFRRGRAQVRGQHVRVTWVKHGRFHGAAQQRLGMVDQVRVQRVIARDQHGHRAPAIPPGAVAVLIARDDPLDTYLVHHPEALLRRPVEATVLDPGNPYVLAPHLCAAAAELPLTEADLALFGPESVAVTEALIRRGMLRRRGPVICWTRRGRAARTGLRGTGGRPVKIVEAPTGRLVGTVDEPSAHVLVHTGAVYPHQGEMYLVARLDLADSVALVEAADPGYATSAREVTAIEVAAELRRSAWGGAAVHFGDVQVTRQVTSFVRRGLETGRPLGEVPLDLPPRTLRTRAVWWTIPDSQRSVLAGLGVDLPGAAHAAEHASIGLLPLFAACDRWDIGGVSADVHPATGQLTVFLYDGHDGGAGFAERGYRAAAEWLRATAEAIRSCECQAGC